MSQRGRLDAEAQIRDICSVDTGVVKKNCMVQEKVLFFYIELELGKNIVQIFTFIL